MLIKLESTLLSVIIKNPSYYISTTLQEIFKAFFKKNESKNNNKKIKNLLQTKNFLVTNFGRSALYIILLHLKKKDQSRKEVLVSSYNYYEVVNMILYAGLKPVFYDLKYKSLNADLSNIKKKLNNNTLAIIITHFNGINQSIQKIKLLTYKKIFLIEDCAIALNTNQKNIKISKFGDYSFYSMNFTKNLNSITGGILKSSKKNINEIKKKILNFTDYNPLDNFKNYITLLLVKMLMFKYFYFIFNFFNKINSKPLRHFFNINFKKNIQKKIPNYYLNKLPNINNEVLAYSFKYLKDENKIRIENNNYYHQLLKNKESIITLIPKENLKLVTLEFPILFKNNFYKTNFLKRVKKNNLDVRKDYYVNCSNLEYLKKFKTEEFVNSKFVEENLVCLPNNPKINIAIIQEFNNYIK